MLMIVDVPVEITRRINWTFFFVLSVVTVLAWVATLSPSMGSAMMIDLDALSLNQASTYMVAWGIMMAAMMLPSAMPMILLYGILRQKQSKLGQKGLSPIVFALVYLVVWLATGLPIYLVNVSVGLLERAYAVFATVAPYLLGASFVLAGLFQFSDFKKKCLKVCQTPFQFLMGHWYTGYKGSLRLSFEHALYCVGCCWALMSIMALLGSMSLRWLLLITVAVFVEKIMPRGQWYANSIGILLILLGFVISFRPDLISLIQGPSMPMEHAQSIIPICAPETLKIK